MRAGAIASFGASHSSTELEPMRASGLRLFRRGRFQVRRERCGVDFDAFFALGEGKADEFVEGHPLRAKLQAIKAGASS